MLTGYVRTASGADDLEQQREQLKQAGCQRIFSDEIQGHQFKQPALTEAIDSMCSGDTLVIWRLDRLGRSLKDIFDKVEALQQRALGLCSVQDEIDTTQPEGQQQVLVFLALGRCEQNLTRERTLSGLQEAWAQGRRSGRMREMTREKVRVASRLMKDPDIPIQEICKRLAISRTTLYRYLSPEGEIRQW